MNNLKELELEKKLISLEMEKAKRKQKDTKVYIKMIELVEKDIETLKEAA
jgi:hypothetical protein